MTVWTCAAGVQERPGVSTECKLPSPQCFIHSEGLPGGHHKDRRTEGCPTLSLDQGPRQAEPQWLTSRLQSQLPDFLVPDPCECLVGEAGVQAGCWPAD